MVVGEESEKNDYQKLHINKKCAVHRQNMKDFMYTQVTFSVCIVVGKSNEVARKCEERQKCQKLWTERNSLHCCCWQIKWVAANCVETQKWLKYRIEQTSVWKVLVWND